MSKNASMIERFCEKILVGDGCWEWTGAKMADGYGNMKVGNKYVRAHRWSYEQFVGSIADGLLVLHRCDNPSCVNPDHLLMGTSQQNTQDAISKRRYRPWGKLMRQ